MPDFSPDRSPRSGGIHLAVGVRHDDMAFAGRLRGDEGQDIGKPVGIAVPDLHELHVAALYLVVIAV